MTSVERVSQMIERATESQQPRFSESGWGMPWGDWPLSMLNEHETPKYSVDSRRRDTYLRGAWRLEPHLAGVVNGVILIDSNRGWSLTGGRNQVNRYQTILHRADNLGWRAFCRKVALSFWATDMGGLVEIGREGRRGPMRALYHLDSARCRMTGNVDYPLEYFPTQGGPQQWEPSDYFRISSMPSDDESFHGLGYCAVSRCIELTKLLYAVLMHDQELTAARAPKGLLLLNNISEAQWQDSLAVREETLNSLERRYYAGVQVIASMGVENIDAKLVGLSQLPQNFDAKVFTDLCMYGYALCFGYDPSEFWPVQFGSIGRGNETDVQHKKASGKGGLDFALALQEQLQAELPSSIDFAFEQRDDSGDLLAISVQQAKLNVVTAAYEAGLMQGAPLVSIDEARQLLVENGIIPQEWTEETEEITLTDTDGLDKMATMRVREAMRRFPTEQIVTVDNLGRMRILYDPDRGFGPKGKRVFGRK